MHKAWKQVRANKGAPGVVGNIGFRPNLSAYDAVHQLKQHIKDGRQVSVDVDLKQFFDTVNHDALMVRIARKVRDKRLLKLIGAYLRDGVLVDGLIQPIRLGVSQGGPLSPLLANTCWTIWTKNWRNGGIILCDMPMTSSFSSKARVPECG